MMLHMWAIKKHQNPHTPKPTVPANLRGQIEFVQDCDGCVGYRIIPRKYSLRNQPREVQVAVILEPYRPHPSPVIQQQSPPNERPPTATVNAMPSPDPTPPPIVNPPVPADGESPHTVSTHDSDETLPLPSPLQRHWDEGLARQRERDEGLAEEHGD